MQQIDTRGRSCPEPVVMTKNVLDNLSEGESFEVLVGEEVARENVSRLVKSSGAELSIEEVDGYYKLNVSK